MDLHSFQTVVIKLLSIITISTSGETINTPPTISFVPAETLQQRVCGRPCPAYAVFLPRHGIMMDDRLNPVKDVHARGILLHELVHYVQWRRSGWQNASNCKEWYAREDEAYRIQYRWLTAVTAGQQGIPSSRRRRVVCAMPDKPEVKQTAARKASAQVAAN